jgi:AcrR family transcriptional regulator
MRIGREPQQDRSRVTRERLLDATIESLAADGWSGTTAVAVAARAGVSRGAAQHHFATRYDLVRGAVERVSDRLADSLRDEVATRGGDERVLTVLELLTDMWTNTAGRAALQLWVAAATDPALHALVLPLEQRFSRELFDATCELLAADLAQPSVREAVRLTMDLTRGVGLGALLRPNLTRRRADLAQWAAVLGAMPGLGSGIGL